MFNDEIQQFNNQKHYRNFNCFYQIKYPLSPKNLNPGFATLKVYCDPAFQRLRICNFELYPKNQVHNCFLNFIL